MQSWQTLFWMSLAAVTVGSLMPGGAIPDVLWSFDKLMHAGAYGWLALAGCAARLGDSPRLWLALFLFGAAVEVAQHFTGRVFSFNDMLANGAGAALALVLSLAWRRLSERRA